MSRWHLGLVKVNGGSNIQLYWIRVRVRKKFISYQLGYVICFAYQSADVGCVFQPHSPYNTYLIAVDFLI